MFSVVAANAHKVAGDVVVEHQSFPDIRLTLNASAPPTTLIRPIVVSKILVFFIVSFLGYNI